MKNYTVHRLQKDQISLNPLFCRPKDHVSRKCRLAKIIEVLNIRVRDMVGLPDRLGHKRRDIQLVSESLKYSVSRIAQIDYLFNQLHNATKGFKHQFGFVPYLLPVGCHIVLNIHGVTMNTWTSRPSYSNWTSWIQSFAADCPDSLWGPFWPEETVKCLLSITSTFLTKRAFRIALSHFCQNCLETLATDHTYLEDWWICIDEGPTRHSGRLELRASDRERHHFLQHHLRIVQLPLQWSQHNWQQMLRCLLQTHTGLWLSWNRLRILSFTATYDAREVHTSGLSLRVEIALVRNSDIFTRLRFGCFCRRRFLLEIYKCILVKRLCLRPFVLFTQSQFMSAGS